MNNDNGEVLKLLQEFMIPPHNLVLVSDGRPCWVAKNHAKIAGHEACVVGNGGDHR